MGPAAESAYQGPDGDGGRTAPGYDDAPLGPGAEHPAPARSPASPAREAATTDPFGVTGTMVGLVAGAVAALAWRRNRPAR